MSSTNVSAEVLVLNGKRYVPEGSAQPVVVGPVSIVRTKSAGVHVGVIKQGTRVNNGDSASATVLNARRLYYWDGAATLSQLAIDGVSKPQNCKFPAAVPECDLIGIVEVIPMTQKAVDSVNSVSVWRA